MSDRKKVDQFCISVKVEIFSDENYRLSCTSRKNLEERVRISGLDLNRAVFYNLIREGSIDWINTYIENTKLSQKDDPVKIDPEENSMKKRVEELCLEFDKALNSNGNVGYFSMTTCAPWKIYLNIYNKYHLPQVRKYMDENNIRKNNPGIEFIIRKCNPITLLGE